MKKLPVLLNTPAKTVMAVGLFILLGEFLIMVLFENAYNALPKDTVLKGISFEFIDPFLLTLLVSPALFLLIFKPMHKQQAELKDAHKKIRQAFQEWVAALDAVNDPIFLHDQQFRILRCNKAYQQCARIPFKQIIGQPYYAVFPKAAGPLPCCLQAMEKTEQEEELLADEAIYRSRTFVIRDEDGAYLYSMHTLEDITERKQAAQERKDLSDRLQHILASTPAVHYACRVDDEHFVPTFVSTNLKGIWGYDPAECLDNVDWWCSGIHPEGRDSVVETLRAAIIAADRSHYVHEYRFRHKDGAFRWVHDELQIIRDQAGQPLEIVGSWLDITERKQAEQALSESEKLYRSLFENMLNGFAYCKMIFEQDQPQDFIYLSSNAAFETLTGLKNVTGKRVSEVIPGIRQSDPRLFEIYGRVSLSGKPEQFEIYVEALQQWFWISVYSPEKGYFVAVFDVITQRKRAEAELSEQIEELRGWHDITLGREMRIIELKHEVDELLSQAGQPPRYPSAEPDDSQEK